MATKRATPAPEDGGPRKRARKPPSTPPFVFNQRHWTKTGEITDCVYLLTSKANSKLVVVKKTMEFQWTPRNDRPYEVRALGLLPDCNRILKPLYVELSHVYPVSTAVAIFPHCPLGDLRQWKEAQFDTRRKKPVPESCIWRFFIQMAQALAFIHKELEPDRPDQTAILHRDIKPGNIMVVENGTTYPSFKLNDFGCAKRLQPEIETQASYCGTYEWQPPENPLINTKAAEVWALGACVHFLATGTAPIGDVDIWRYLRQQVRPGYPEEARPYSPRNRYWAARVPRKVTAIDQPIIEGPDTTRSRPPREYSNDLNAWMMGCLEHQARHRPTGRELVQDMIPDAKDILRQLGGNAALVDLDLEIAD